jgi:hypothetical protein
VSAPAWGGEQAEPAHAQCVACGAPLEADQEWCLECGAARTSLEEPPDWRIAAAIVVVVVVLVTIALVIALP